MQKCNWCGKLLLGGSINSDGKIFCSGECYDFSRESQIENAAKAIKEPSDFKEWESYDMSEIFWIHLGKYVKHPNKYSLSLMKNAYYWAIHADHGLSNSFYNALKWAKIDLWKENPQD